MSKFIVQGGRTLKGEVFIQGSKNTIFPLVAASVLADGKCELENVPDILDVRNFLKILKSLGGYFEFSQGRLVVDCRNIKRFELPRELVGKLRGSILFAGPLLGRFGQVTLPYPGGDAIGARPIDVHLEGFRKLGAEVREGTDKIEISAQKLKGNNIVLEITSVTGTENLILAAVKAEGQTEIRLAAIEPHVQMLCRFLVQMGAQIEGLGTPFLRITGGKQLHGAKCRLNADEIAALTFCVAGAATKSNIFIKNTEQQYLDAPLNALARMNVNLSVSGQGIEIRPPSRRYQGTHIVTGVYPQLLTDYQPLFGVLATQAEGETSIHDWMYEGRQGYLKSLAMMGAKVEFDDVHRARIYGPTQLQAAEIMTPDIRAGASILIAALVAKGQSIIYNAEIIDRGYERLDEKLRQLGADIRRVE